MLAVVRRGRTRLTGLPKLLGKTWVLEPDDPRVLHRPEVAAADERCVEGMVVVATIDRYPDDSGRPMTVQIDRVLGPPDSLATEQMKILIERGIDPEFPADVVAEAAAAPQAVAAADLAGRDDLRHLPFMTIDPVDARDFDDAVCAEVLGDGNDADILLHVAVADVSHYVREGTATAKPRCGVFRPTCRTVRSPCFRPNSVRTCVRCCHNKTDSPWSPACASPATARPPPSTFGRR